MMRSKRLILLAGGVLLAAGLMACGDDDGGGGGGAAGLRVVHASPDAPNVDVFVDGEFVLGNVPYGAASGYLPVDSGTRNIQVRAAGTSLTVIDADVDLGRNTDNTLLAINTLANIEPLLLEDDTSAPGAGLAKLRAVHAAAGAQAVDIYVTAPDAPLGTPTLEDVPFGAASEYLSVPAGMYRVRVTPAGTTNVVIDTGAVTLLAGSVSTGVALDADGGGAPFSILLLNDLG